MNINENVREYNLEKNNGISLSFLILSEKRKNLLLLMRDSSKTLQEVREYLHVASSGIIPEIRKMEKKQLIYQTGRKYALTEIGEVAANYIHQFERILKIFNENPNYWNEHNISGIPHEFRLRLYELENYKIFKSAIIDIFRSQEECIKNLLKARGVKGVFSVLYPQYIECVFNLVDRGIDVSIVVSRELLEKIKERYRTELKRCLGYKNSCISVCDEKIEIELIVADFILSIRFFLKDGTYDLYQNILSYEKSAIRWGEDLFNYYERHSKKVGIQDL